MSEPNGEAILFRKIAEVMAEVGRVEKRGRNQFHGYDYVTEADLVEEVRAKLASRKVALIPSVQGITERGYETEKGKHSVITTATLTFTFVDGETGAMFRAEWAGQGDDPADKGLYSAYTGALKYFLMKTFLIPTGDDPEANTGSDERGQQRQSPPRRNDDGSIKPSAKQREMIKNLTSQKSLTTHQLAQMVGEVTVTENVEITEGWGERYLSGGREGTASALIDRLMKGPYPKAQETPTPSSDVPSDAPAHEPQSQEGLPWGDAA